VLSKFPLEVVSEDEKDTVDGNDHYCVIKLEWRSSAGRNLFQILDALQMASHFTADGRPRPGRFSHARTLSDRVYTGPAPPGLPRNLYDSEFIKGLTPEELDRMNIQPEVDLSVPAEVIRFVYLYSPSQTSSL